MKNNIKLFVILLLYILSSFYLYSCTCINKLDVKDAIKSNDFIFIGKVQKIDLVSIENKAFFKILFRVKSRFKGKIKKYITIYTPPEPNMCGFPFNLKNEYIVYANLYGNVNITKSKILKNIIETDICSRTKVYDKTEILKLRKHKKEKPPIKLENYINKKAVLNDD